MTMQEFYRKGIKFCNDNDCNLADIIFEKLKNKIYQILFCDRNDSKGIPRIYTVEAETADKARQIVLQNYPGAFIACVKLLEDEGENYENN